jgi:NAD+ synthase (glutamine-hydrolysing)
MKLIKTAAAVVNQTPFDWENNRRNILNSIREARKAGVSVLCLPELCITGYGCEDDFFRTDLRQRALDELMDIIPETSGMIVSLGLPVLYNNALFNCAAMVVDGKLAGLVAKQNLAGDGIHYEPRWFDAWTEQTVSHIDIRGQRVPIGDLHFLIGGVKIGFEICEDAWVGKRPGVKLARKAVDIILNPSASHFSFGKFEIRKRLVLEGSRAFCASYVYANLLGNDAGRAIYDGGAIIASAGKMQAVGPRFSFADYSLTTAIVDVHHTRMAQSRTYSFSPELKASADDCIEVEFHFPEIVPTVAPPPVVLCDWEKSSFIKEEELSRSIALGLFDYLRKTRSGGYVVSLSGGADSAAVSSLVSLMVELSVQELGMDGFAKKMPQLKDIDKLKVPRELIARLLTCAYQGTKNSSTKTRESARKLAEYLGAAFYDLDVDDIVKAYTSMVAKALGRDLTWQTDDIALQNIQARVRNPGIWLIANIKDAVLLCTSNRSEGAVGYCTMDGDTAGGLAPIAGVDKAFIRHWLRWMEQQGPAGLHPYTGLSLVNNQTPGPELRPQDMHQAGEKDLMPYELLDAIEEAAIENNQSVKDCYYLMRVRFPQYEPEQMANWIVKFFRLWSRNQWKRERLAPALHVDTRNLDPRTWRRSPILSGGFKREIEDMWQAVKTDKAKLEGGSMTQAADKTALVIVDVQKGFGSKGELPVADAEQIIPVINELQNHFEIIVATQDWHPADHVSFAQTHSRAPGECLSIDGVDQPLFNVHCVAGTTGSEFIDGLDTSKVTRIFQKGTKSDTDSFSGFIDNKGGKATDLEDFLKQRGVKTIYVTGLATDYCVERTATDGVALGFDVSVVEDACRGVNANKGDVDRAIERMKRAGVKMTTSNEVLKKQLSS